MKILVYKWSVFNQYDIIETFKTCGHEVDTFEERKDYEGDDEDYSSDFEACIQNSSYDCAFTVNFFGKVSDACQKHGIKYIAWTCDSPLISMHHQSVFNECNYIFIFDKVNYFEFKSMGIKHVYYLPLAVDTVRLDRIIESSPESLLSRFDSEISFVGGLYSKNSYDDIAEELPDYLRGYFDAAMMAQMDIYGENIFDRLLTVDILHRLEEFVDFKKTERSMSDIGLVFSTTFLGFKVAQLERIQNLNLLAKKHSVDLYTDGNDDRLLGVNIKGTINYREDMPKVFNRSKINLNYTIRNIRSGIPLRVWDILGAGGFLLTNFQAELPMYFENGKDIVYFDSTMDMEKKAEYYLKHEDERLQIAQNGHETVKKYHSYENRIAQILEVVPGS